MSGRSGDSSPECTVWCRSWEHAIQLMAAITCRPPTDQLQRFCRSLCHNFPLTVDQLGRNVLHLSASCGDSAFVKWLLEKCHSEVDCKDLESGWTALHRSIFYGQIGCAKTLIQFGAKLDVTDRDHCTPLELLMLDRPPYIEYSRTDPSDCYVWGSNDNFNLGVKTEQSRKSPEIINTFKRDNISIKEVLIQKFHSVFLTNDGKVYTCGHGHGGRLGHNSESLSITPKLVELNDSSFVESIASGQDHIILLVRHLIDKSVHIYSCGLNTNHVLGHIPAPEKLLTPKLICLKSLKLKQHNRLGDIVGVGAARYHSLFYTKEELFTFGLNVGQIGHSKTEPMQLIPHKVSALNFRDTGTKLEIVVTSDGAIVCSTNKGDVFVLHEYQCRKVASQQFDIQQICVIGGHLDERMDLSGIIDSSRVELQIMLLTKMRNIYLWRGSDPTLVRCLIGFGRELSVTHICLNISRVGFVTKDGEVFFGSISNRKSIDLEQKKPLVGTGSDAKAKSNDKQLTSKPSAQQVKTFVKFVDKEKCHTIRVKKQSFIQRAVAVFCDDKNRNFAVLESSPNMGMTETAHKPDSQMVVDMKMLFETSHMNDDTHDVVIKVGNRQYFAHKFILSNRSEFFRKKFGSDSDCNSITFDTNFISIDSFDQLIKFIYYNSNDMFEDGKRLNWTQLKATNENHLENKPKNSNKKADKKKCSNSNPLKELIEASKKLGINWFNKWIANNGVKIVGNKVKVIEHCLPPKLTFDRLKHQLYDVVIKSEDGVEFNCHKCILMSRLDYFRGMLGSGWIETSSDKALTLPIPSKILDIVLDYVYRDEAPKLESIEEPEFICHVLVIADQYLIPRLKTYCEYVLVNLLTLKNASELLELSYIYNADQLKRCCLDFICINLQTVIETKTINVLSDEAINELTNCYQNMITRPHNRRIARYSDAPNAEELDQIFCCFDSDDDFSVNIDENKKAILKQKAKIKRSSRQRIESNSSDIVDSKDFEISKLLLSSPKEPKEPSKPLDLEAKTDKREELPQKAKSSKWKPLDSKPEISSKPTPIKWGQNSSSIPAPISLKDIIKEEEKVLTKISKSKAIVPSNSSKESSFAKQSPIAIPKRDVRNHRNHSSKYNEMSFERESVSPKSFAEMAVSPPKPFSNPWKTIGSVSPNDLPTDSSLLSSYPKMSTISMADIVRSEEEKQIQTLKALQTKPLKWISIEDKAIEELLLHYRANGNPEEYITVERVVSQVAEPVWSRNQ